MNTRKESTNKRKRFVSTPNDGSGSGGANQGIHAALAIHVERSANSAASTSIATDNVEFINNDVGKEASLSVLNADLNIRRRRRMSSFTDQSKTTQLVDEEAASYFNKVKTSMFVPVDNQVYSLIGWGTE